MQADIRLALDLASCGRPTGEAADALRNRLRGHIRHLADPADAYAKTLADSRAQDIVVNTVRHARAVAEDTVVDPAASLRLLAKAVDHLGRYVAQHQHAPRLPAPLQGAGEPPAAPRPE
ncbi:DUF6415 family natural product biosynthesis protein [Streptomyces sp. NPDC096030]|uniref:DUF6415 family natural product biosynthesis protein n=1 Tax=Streptomyces sp. NPDC096030 TaxID=3155423 RepID=UPI00331A9165